MGAVFQLAIAEKPPERAGPLCGPYILMWQYPRERRSTIISQRASVWYLGCIAWLLAVLVMFFPVFALAWDKLVWSYAGE